MSERKLIGLSIEVKMKYATVWLLSRGQYIFVLPGAAEAQTMEYHVGINARNKHPGPESSGRSGHFISIELDRDGGRNGRTPFVLKASIRV